MTQVSLKGTDLKKARRVVKNDAAIQALITKTPAEIETWITNNVNDMDSAKLVLSTLAKVVSVLMREHINKEV